MKTSVQSIDGHHAQIGLLISDYQDGLISDEERIVVEQHLAECEVCRNFLKELEQIRDVIRSLYSSIGGSNRTEYKAVMLRTIYREKVAELEKKRRFFQKNLAKQQKAERKAKNKTDLASQKEERLRDWQESEEKIKQ